MRCFYFSILLSLFCASDFLGQELPPIANYTPLEYGAENQNWGISQTVQKNIYVANNGGLLEFNGAEWKLYGSPNGSTIRSVKAINEIIYTGCYSEFGFWKKNSFGDLSYTSLSSELDIELLEDEEFWNIMEFDEWVLFQSLERIYIYNSADRSVKFLDSSSTKAHMFAFEGAVYYHSVSNGLFKIENGASVLVSDAAVVKDNVVLGIFNIDEKAVLVTDKAAFYFLNNGNLSRWNIPFDRESDNVNVYSGKQLWDGSIVLGTISNGIYHIDRSGAVIRRINQEKGLNNNTVLDIFQDEEQNLWLALDNGISVLNLNSPFNEYIDKNGKIGVVYASVSHEGNLYLGTNQGLFSKKLNSNEDFNLVDDTEGQVWLLKIIDGTLLCGHNNGTYKIQEGKAKLISDFPGTWDVKPIPNQKNLFLQGNYNGLSVLTNENGIWQLQNVIEGFDISSRFFEFVDDTKLIVNHEFKGIYRLQLNASFSKVVAIENEAPKGIGASLVSYADEVLYTSSKGIFKYDQLEETFVTDSLLTSGFFGHQDDPIGVFIADNESKRLWSFTNTSVAFAAPAKFSSQLQVNKVSIPRYVRKNLGVLGFENLTRFKKDYYLIGISNGYLTLDLNKLSRNEYIVRINSVSKKTNYASENKIDWNQNNNFSFKENSLSITYNVPEYNKYTEVSYSHKLEGSYDDWSDWSSEPSMSFDNLPYGEYSFKVRAKVGNHLSKNEATYDFTIERPWYVSNLALVLYFLAFTLSAFFIHKLYKRYYKKQQEQLLVENKKKLKRKKLKAQKKIVQIRNEKLHEEVENKNRELAISTMSIIKKNEFLNAIKNQLKKSNDDPNVKSVIRTIDRNINNEDDWKFFEDAFNNADKDFLKKIKGIHADLTSNDLRLCAYLRLNLSSKEIAPLLNISVKSVEVKRYRLRKKMQLQHEEGLVDYIMDM
jgi:DNA-binding CsgD family transcriptional regulator